MNDTTSLAEIARGDLAGLQGGIVGPGDPGYDEARAVYNGMIDRRPAVIVRCSSAEDVARTIAFARAHDAPIAVRGGGHNGGGLGVVDDGVVIDLAGDGRRSWSTRTPTPSASAAAHLGRRRRGDGRARPRDAGGIISTTGVGGLTLGGGIGHLTRALRPDASTACSAADVVLADGTQVHASARRAPRPVLGAARRRRQLRRRHGVRVPHPPGRRRR